jgi:hypothetical protein
MTRSARPYSWNDVIISRGLHGASARIWSEARDHGLRDGLFTPGRWQGGSYAAVVLAGPEPELSDPMMRVTAEVLSGFYLSEARRLLGTRGHNLQAECTAARLPRLGAPGEEFFRDSGDHGHLLPDRGRARRRGMSQARGPHASTSGSGGQPPGSIESLDPPRGSADGSLGRFPPIGTGGSDVALQLLPPAEYIGPDACQRPSRFTRGLAQRSHRLVSC